MAEEESHYGLEALEKCEEQVIITIKNNLNDIARFLRDKKILQRRDYNDVTNPRSRDTADDKASVVFQKLTDKVDEDDNNYLVFVDFLRTRTKSGKTVEMLDKAYAELRGETNDLVNDDGATSKSDGRGPSDSVPPPNIPKEFSEKFSPREFADWMKYEHFLSSDNCDIIMGKGISGLAFTEVTETDLREFGFVGAGYLTLKAILKKVSKVESDSVMAVKTSQTAQVKQASTAKEEEVATGETDELENRESYPAKDRGTYMPKLKLQESDEIETLNIGQELNIPNLDRGYYDMSSKKHGVCLIINNETFEGHSKREGTERDEYNLIQTWQYLGYHVEVRRELTFDDIQDIFCDIDDFLQVIKKKAKPAVLTNDSFVCCILSHGNKSVIYGTDSKEVTIEYLEAGLGASETLSGWPKLFFIQACQGEKYGTKPVNTKLHVRKNIQADGEIQTSRRADTYISYATAVGGKAYRNIKSGSWYIRTLCKILCEQSKRNPLDQMQMSINEIVAKENEYTSNMGAVYKQQPSGSNQLSRNVHFFFQ